MLTAIFATGILMVPLIGCVLAYLDVRAEAEHQSLLSELWDDDEDWPIETRAEIERLPEAVS